MTVDNRTAYLRHKFRYIQSYITSTKGFLRRPCVWMVTCFGEKDIFPPGYVLCSPCQIFELRNVLSSMYWYEIALLLPSEYINGIAKRKKFALPFPFESSNFDESR